MQKIDQLIEKDKHLIKTASERLERSCDEPLQTVAAAIRTKSGKEYSAMNLYHFTGGPCAEFVLLANAFSDDKDLDTIVAVHYDDNNEIEVINSCGRCRQVFIDYAPGLKVLTAREGSVEVVDSADLLPDSYKNKATQYKRIAKADSSEEPL